MAAERPEVGKQLSVVAANVRLRLSEVSRDIWEYLIAEIPQIRGDQTVVKVLEASVEENVTTLLHIFENDMTLAKLKRLWRRRSMPGGWPRGICP
jgi:hypothetical protein